MVVESAASDDVELTAVGPPQPRGSMFPSLFNTRKGLLESSEV